MPSDFRGVRSTAAIFGHPIHPMLVVFPIGFLVGALATDLAFWGTSDPFWARASEWLLGAGIVMGALAAVAGLIEFVTISRVRSLAAGWVHFLGTRRPYCFPCGISCSGWVATPMLWWCHSESSSRQSSLSSSSSLAG